MKSIGNNVTPDLFATISSIHEYLHKYKEALSSKTIYIKFALETFDDGKEYPTIIMPPLTLRYHPQENSEEDK